MKKIETTNMEYEVSSLYPSRRFTDVYNCENECRKCKTKCEFGIRMMNSIDVDIVGA